MSAATFEEILARDGRLVYKAVGTSMEPMLRQNRDVVVIEPPRGRLRRGEAALYRRGGRYVLHRVVAVKPEGYVMRGDNVNYTEQVSETDVIGVLTAFVRDGKEHRATGVGFRLCGRLRNALCPLRRLRRRLARRWKGRKTR